MFFAQAESLGHQILGSPANYPGEKSQEKKIQAAGFVGL